MVDIVIPKSWSELSQTQLLFVFKLLSLDLTEAEVRTHCLMRWGGIRVRERLGGGRFRLSVCRQDIVADKDLVAALAATLSWLGELPSSPVRLERIGGHRALHADFQGVEFEKYIVCDNLFQGFLHTREFDMLRQMAEVMYGISPKKTLSKPYLLNVFYWFAALKQRLSAMFPHFLRPVGTDQGQNLLGSPVEALITEAVNAQIRALTKGDVTKESRVLSLDTWRALTELDALARETEEISRKRK